MIDPFSTRAARFLTDLQTIQRRATRLQQDLTSGVRIHTASDAPDQVAGLLRVQADLAHNDQIAKNLGIVKSEVDTASSVIQDSLKRLDEAISLGTQAASGTQSAEKRQIIAEQIGAIFEQFLNAANTTSGGRYLFGGDDDGTAPYRADSGQPAGVAGEGGAAATRRVEGPDGSFFTVDRTAAQVFGPTNADGSPAPGNVFAALRQLQQAAASGTDAELTAALEAVKGAQTWLNQQGAAYGRIQSRLTDALDQASRNASNWKIRLGEIRDTDTAAAILDLEQTSTQREAAIAAQAQLPRTSLFDYLK